MRDASGANRPELGAQPVLRAETSLRALPGVLPAIALLTVAHEALEATVQQALSDNPMLRRRSTTSPCPICGRRGPWRNSTRCSHLARGGGDGPSVRPFDSLEVLAGCEIEPEHRHALPIVIDHLGDRGLLDSDPDEIAAQDGLSPQAVADAVRAIKSVGPVGVAERSVTELLVAQARALVARGEAAPWFVELVREHLPAVAAEDVPAVAAALGVDVRAMSGAFRLVRARLRPFVDIDRDPPAMTRMPPDVFVYRGTSGALEVEVADSRWFGLRLAAVPAGLRAHAEAVEWLREHEQAAQLLLRQLDTRADVLRRVATWVVRRQVAFFDVGPAGHVQLTRTQVADELALHPSTVSRTVSGKTLRSPDGTMIDFAELFGGARAVKARIVELAGDSRMSDSRVSQELAASGFSVARRTVAKYRAELGIAPAVRRT